MARHTSQPQSLLVGGRPAVLREVLAEGPWAWVLSVAGCALGPAPPPLWAPISSSNTGCQ